MNDYEQQAKEIAKKGLAYLTSDPVWLPEGDGPDLVKLITAALRQAAAAQLEQDCAAACRRCGDTEHWQPAEPGGDDDVWYYHRRVGSNDLYECDAAAIRARAAQE